MPARCVTCPNCEEPFWIEYDDENDDQEVAMTTLILEKKRAQEHLKRALIVLHRIKNLPNTFFAGAQMKQIAEKAVRKGLGEWKSDTSS